MAIVNFMTRKYGHYHKKFKTTLTLTVNNKGSYHKNKFSTILKHNKKKKHHIKFTKAKKNKYSSSRSKTHNKKQDDSGYYHPNSGKDTFFSSSRGFCGWKNSKSDLIVAVNDTT